MSPTNMLQTLVRRMGTRWFAALVLATLAGITIWINAPGHIAVDAVIQLHEGQTGQYVSFNPPFMGYLLGKLDLIGNGPELFFLLNIGLFFGAVYLLLPSDPLHRGLALPVLAFVCLGPVLLIYNGTIWKDVFFANLSLFGFAMLAHSHPGRLRLGIALLAFASVTLVRQQGMLIVLGATLCYALIPANLSWRKIGLRWLLSFGAVLLAAHLAYSLILHSGIHVRDPGFSTGLAVLMVYDLAGTAYTGGAGVLKILAEHGLDVPAIMNEVMAHYSATRQDFLRFDNSVHAQLDPKTLIEQWRFAITEYPLDYLGHRTNAFMWLLGVNDVKLCAPIHLGVNGPHDLTAAMGLDQLRYPYQGWLWDYASKRFDGLWFRPWVYVMLAVGSLMWLKSSRPAPYHRALIILLLCGLAYVTSYFVLSMACDFRYSYLLVAASQLVLALILPSMLVSGWQWLRQKASDRPTA